LIRSASDLIDLDHANYQYVAARLLLFSLRKGLYGRTRELPSLREHITKLAYQGLYDKEIFDKYSAEEIDKVDSFIDHDRDFMFTYAGLRQVC
jgi:ribonucleoside-diphosphate reductase alpha chain